MLLVAVAVLLATSAGIACERRGADAQRLARLALGAMLYVLVPFIAYVGFAHLSLSLDAGVGLALAYCGLGLAGALAWALGRRLGLAGPALGAVIVSVIVVNTGYLGLPVTEALLGGSALSHAVAYDQVISGTMWFTAGFAVGAAFGTRRRAARRGRPVAFLTRNPPLLAAVAGLVVPAAWAPHAFVLASRTIVYGLLPVGFFAVGVYLSAERRDDHAPLLEWPDRRVGLALALRFGVTPLLLLAAGGAGLAIPDAYLIQAAMATGINTLIVGHAFGLDQRLIATIIVWSTLAVLVVASAAYLA